MRPGVLLQNSTVMRMLFASLLLLAAFSSCNFMGGRRVRGNGTPGTETRNVGAFDGIHVLGSMDVVITPGTEPSVKVEADENLLKYILTNREGNTLVIRTRNGYNLDSRSGIKVYVTAPTLEELEVSGSGSVVSNGKVTANNR